MFKKFAFGAAFALATALSAQAATTVTDLGLVTGTTTKGTSTVDGSFSDLFNFTVGSNIGTVLVASGATSANTFGVSLSSIALYLGTFTSASALAGQTALAFSNTPLFTDLGGGDITDTVTAKSLTLDPSATYTLAINGSSMGASRYTTIVQLTPVPEPETYAMLLAGLGVMGFVAKRRKGKAKAEADEAVAA